MPGQLSDDEKLLIALDTQVQRALKDIQELSSEMKTYPSACRKELYDAMGKIDGKIDKIDKDLIYLKKNGNGKQESTLAMKIIFQLAKAIGYIGASVAFILGVTQ